MACLGRRSLVVFALVVCPALAGAQSLQGPTTARLVFGPLSLAPKIELSNVGVDTNVFNEADRPTKDFTATFTPSLDTRLRIGRTMLTSTTSSELVYFRRSRTQRSASLSEVLKFDAALSRVRPYLIVGRESSHRRPNLEIDARVAQTTKTYHLGSSVDLGSRTRLGVGLSREDLRFDQGGSIDTSLGRRSDRFQGTVEVDLTPLTTWMLRTAVERDTFRETSLRDSDSQTMVTGFQLKPLALISGSIEVGYRHFVPVNPRVPVFTGVVAATDIAYLWRETTKLGLTLDRSVEYSIEPDQPYFIVTSGRVSVTQVMGSRWDIGGRFGRDLMAYRRVTDNQNTSEIGRRDRQVTYGTGLGYRLTPEMRVGVDMAYGRRLTPIAARQYEGFRFGGTLTYAY